ncbi:MAG: hypothetical protein V3U32_06755 [Anaerolineales bacterium]
MTKSHLDPCNIPPAFVHGIGLVARSFSVAEMMLQSIIHDLARIADA